MLIYCYAMHANVAILYCLFLMCKLYALGKLQFNLKWTHFFC